MGYLSSIGEKTILLYGWGYIPCRNGTTLPRRLRAKSIKEYATPPYSAKNKFIKGTLHSHIGLRPSSSKEHPTLS